MKRKAFLGSVLATVAAVKALAASQSHPKPNDASTLIPPYLKPGDTIGITSPAGYITVPEIQSAVQKLQEWGFKVKIGNSIGRRAFTFGGTDSERLLDMQQMLDDTSVKAILCARGGYGGV